MGEEKASTSALPDIPGPKDSPLGGIQGPAFFLLGSREGRATQKKGGPAGWS